MCDAEKTALRLVARAEQSEAGLLRKLLARGFSRADSVNALAALKESGMVDDERFAGLWAASRIIHKNESPGRLVTGLLRRGINSKTAKKAVKKAVPASTESEILERYVRAYGILTDGTGAKLLRNEGFSADAVTAWLDGAGC